MRVCNAHKLFNKQRERRCMKIFKKLLTVLTAFVMAFTIAVFAACVPVENDPKDPGSGNTDNPDNPDNPNNPGNDPNAALINGVLTQEYVAATESMSVNQTSEYNYYALTSDGKKGSALTEKNYTNSYEMSQSGKFNLADGDADISIVGTQIDTNKEHNSYNGTTYDYNFLRDWNAFSVPASYTYDETTDIYTPSNTKPVTDFSNITLSYGGSATEGAPLDFEALGGMSAFANLGLGVQNFSVLSLGNYFGGLTVKGETATVDINKMVYNLATGVNAFLAQVDENTTVGDLLKNDTVKAILSSLLNGIPAAKLVNILQTVVSAIPNIGEMLTQLNIDLTKILVAPNENETTYDYFVRIISSNELKNALNKILEVMIPAEGNVPAISVPSTLDKMDLNFFLKLAGTNVDQIKSYVADYTKDITEHSFVLDVVTGYRDITHGDFYGPNEVKTAEEDAVLVPETFGLKIEKAEMGYTFKNGALTKQVFRSNPVEFSESYTDSISEYDPDKHEWIYKYDLCERSGSVNVNMTIEYLSEKQTLKNISSNKTVETRREYVEEVKSFYLYLDRIGEYENASVEPHEVVYDVKSVVENNMITGYVYKLSGEPDSAYKPLGDTLSVEVTLTPWDSKEEIESETRTVIFNVDKALPVTGDGYDGQDAHVEIRHEQYDIRDYNEFYKAYVYYGNTVSGILAGKASTVLPDYEG